jgi:hypothetical protein
MAQLSGAGAYGDAGTKDTRVDRIEEGLEGLETTDNIANAVSGVLPAANRTRNSFDSGKATGIDNVKFTGTIDTTWTGGTRPDLQVQSRSSNLT